MIDKIIERLEAVKIRYLEESVKKGNKNTRHEVIGFCDGINTAIDIVKQVAAEDNWIKCSDRLPTTDGRYEVTIKGSKGHLHTEMCNFQKNSRVKQWGCGMRPVNVIAWRNRPEPCKEE